MKRLAEPDPFAPSAPVARHAEDDLEARWFAAPRRAPIRSSRPPPCPPIDDPVADTWFR